MKKLLTLFVISLSLFSCKKSLTCEKWEIQDYFIPKPSGFAVYTTPIADPDVCGDELKYAHSGSDKEINDNSHGTTFRKYLYKLP